MLRKAEIINKIENLQNKLGSLRWDYWETKSQVKFFNSRLVSLNNQQRRCDLTVSKLEQQMEKLESLAQELCPHKEPAYRMVNLPAPADWVHAEKYCPTCKKVLKQYNQSQISRQLSHGD